MSLELRPCDFQTAVSSSGSTTGTTSPLWGTSSRSRSMTRGGVRHGVCMVGRPIGRYLDDGLTLEVNRCCTDGTKNACTMLYGAAQRAAAALGYKRIITYTLESENGSSLRASNWICDGPAGGTHWTGQRYEQTELVLDEMKVRWRKEL